MESNNPVLNRAPGFARGGYAGFDAPARGAARGAAAGPAAGPAAQPSLEDLYGAPSATPVEMGRMTYDDVVVRTGATLLVVVAGAVVGWMVPPLGVLGLVVGLVLGMVNSFKREPSPALILAYAAFEGLFLGGISQLVSDRVGYDGIVVQAVLATFTTFGVMLALYRSRVLRATPRFTRILVGAVMGYALFSLVNFVFVLFGSGLDLWSGGLGMLVGAVGTVLAALSLVLDFDAVERGVRNGVPQRYAWTAAFGLTVTLVWLYIEFLRLLAILRGDD
jgi:uncharacterized YccA/Bax inhibitor family protein